MKLLSLVWVAALALSSAGSPLAMAAVGVLLVVVYHDTFSKIF